MGNPIQTTYPDEAITRAVYDARSQVLFSDDRHFPGAAANGTHKVYDPLGRVIRAERLADVRIDIDGVAHKRKLVSAGALLSVSSTAYDDGERVRFTTNALGTVTEYTKDDDRAGL